MLTADVQERPATSVTESRRILLVEDHEPTLEVLSRLLTRAGHQIIPAQSVEAAKMAARIRMPCPLSESWNTCAVPWKPVEIVAGRLESRSMPWIAVTASPSAKPGARLN